MKNVIKSVRTYARKIIAALVALFAVATFIVFNGSTQHLQTSVLHSVDRTGILIALESLKPALAKEEIPPEPVVSVCNYEAPKKPAYSGEFVTKELNVNVESGEDFSVLFQVKNTGNIAWFGDFSGCSQFPVMRLGTARTTDRDSIFYHPAYDTWAHTNRIKMLDARVMPGETATFSLSSKAPKVKSEIFREYFQPVVEGVSWLQGSNTIGYMDVNVGVISEELEYKRTYMGMSGAASTLDLSGEKHIQVDISDQRLRLKFGETVVREYIVSTGAYKTPTPIGKFKILNKQDLRIGAKKPHYRMPQWQGFTKWGHGLHALPYLANDKGVFWREALNHIGTRVSHGCIRLLPEDAVDLYGLTEIGMEIKIQA